MTEVSRNLRHIFLTKIPPILKLEVGFFSDRNFFADFRKLDMFISPEVYFYKKKIGEPFWIIHHHHSSSFRPPLRGGCQERGVAVRWKRLRCTRLQHRTCKTSRGNFASHGLSAHGLSTERARLAEGILIFFSQKIPDFEN